MKKFFVILLSTLLIFNLALMSAAKADSPVTSTPFSNAYLDIEMVKKARTTGELDKEIAEYLSLADQPLEVKAAVINSIYNHSNVWQIRNNAEIYTEYVYQSSLAEIDLELLSPKELLVIGYLALLDDYFQPESALLFLEKARAEQPDSFIIAMIEGLAEAQQLVFEPENVTAWKLMKEKVSNPSLQEDRLRDEALSISLEYLYLYRSPQDDISLFLNDKLRIYEAEPVILKDRVIVPWQELSKDLKVEAELNEEYKQIIIKGDVPIVMNLEQKHAEVNGNVKMLDQEPVMINGQIMIPLRFVSETLGAEVCWDVKTRTVTIEVQ